jgi:predicted nucleic acid-binding protein
MLVAVETNFILELALQQAAAECADNILKLAESKQIELAVPACAFPEAYANITMQSKKRRRLLEELKTELNQMARSQFYAGLRQTSKSITYALASSETVHFGELTKTADRLRACATIIPLTTEVTRDMSFLDLTTQLDPADAFIYVSVDHFLKERASGTKLFVTKDKDFEQAEGLLKANGIQLITSFGTAFGAIKKALAAT